jgi:regulator of replication initiation timing
MNNSVKTLHDQNLRLRNEIQKLKSSIRELSGSTCRSLNNESKELPPQKLSALQKENLIENLKKQIENVKKPSNPSPKQALQEIKEVKWKNLPPSGKVYTSSNCSERVSMRASKAVQENLSKISKLSESHSSKGQAPSLSHSKHARLLDSFQSYYESEEENLSKFGKCELSYIEYKKDHEKGARRKERKMQEEIEELRKENSELKLRLQKFGLKTKEKSGPALSVTPRKRSSSRISQKSFRTCRSSNSFRRKPCLKCVSLLAKGFSTAHCNKHRFK